MALHLFPMYVPNQQARARVEGRQYFVLPSQLLHRYPEEMVIKLLWDCFVQT